MKRYLLTLTAILLLVGIIGLPPRFYDASRWFSQQHRTEERQRYKDLYDEIQVESWRFQRVQWRDSVSTALQAVDPRTDPYIFRLPPGTHDSLVTEMDRGIRLHLQAIGATPPKVPVGVFLIPRNAGKHPAAPRDPTGSMWSQEIYVAREGQDPFCGLVQPVDIVGSNGVARTVHSMVFAPPGDGSNANTLRICGYFARYGVPGPEVSEWLRGGAAYFGSGYDFDRRSLLYGRRWPGILQPEKARGPFGLMVYRSFSPRGLACLAGVGSACGEMFQRGEKRLFPYWARRFNEEHYTNGSPVDYFGSRYRYDTDFGSMGSFLFISLEREFGPERFEAFWTSPLPVPEAFQAAFGISADEWVMSWARGFFGSADRGPAVPLKATLLSFLTFGIFGGGALFMGRRKG